MSHTCSIGDIFGALEDQEETISASLSINVWTFQTTVVKLYFVRI